MKGQFVTGLLGLAVLALLSNTVDLWAQTTVNTETSVCDVLKQTSAFDGRVLKLSGVAGNSFHQVDFWNPDCPSAAMHLRFADSYKLGDPSDEKYFRMLKKEGSVSIVVDGRFLAKEGSFGPEGSRFEFQISRIIEVQKLTPEYRKRYGIGSGHTTLN